MKKILFIILILSGIIKAQTFGDSTFYGNVTSVNDYSTFQLRQNSQTRTITWKKLNELLDLSTDFPNQTNEWNAAQTYKSGLLFGSGGYLQLPSASVGTTVRQVYFDISDSTLYIMDASGNPIPFASRAYGDATYATSSGATTLPSTYMTLATSQVVTGAKDVNSLYDFRGGSVYLPYKSSYTASAKNQSLFVYSDGTIRGTLANSSNDAVDVILATQAWVTANYPAVSGYVQSTGTQTGISSTLTWSSGTITPYILSFGSVDAGKSFFFPKDKNRAVSATSASAFVDDNDNNRLVIYDKSGVETPYMRETDTQDKIEETLSSNAPTDLTGDDATLDWTDKNYNQAKCGGSEQPITITVENYTSGWISFSIDNQGDDVTISISGVTIKYPYGVTPDFSDGKLHKVNLEYYSSTVCLLTEVTFD